MVLFLSYSLILLLLDGLRGLEKQIETEGAWFADDIDEKRDRKPLEIPPRKFSFQALWLQFKKTKQKSGFRWWILT